MSHRGDAAAWGWKALLLPQPQAFAPPVASEGPPPLRWVSHDQSRAWLCCLRPGGLSRGVGAGGARGFPLGSYHAECCGQVHGCRCPLSMLTPRGPPPQPSLLPKKLWLCWMLRATNKQSVLVKNHLVPWRGQSPYRVSGGGDLRPELCAESAPQEKVWSHRWCCSSPLPHSSPALPSSAWPPPAPLREVCAVWQGQQR